MPCDVNCFCIDLITIVVQNYTKIKKIDLQLRWVHHLNATFLHTFFVPPFQNIKMFDFIDTDAYKVYNIN